MTPTDLQDLQAVRAAAEDTETLNYCITQDGEEFVKVPPHEMMEMRNYILATIPPDAKKPVTAETLESWGFVTLDGMAWNHKQLTGTFCFEHDALSWWHTGNRTAVISSICQFTQLANALGISKIKQASECG